MHLDEAEQQKYYDEFGMSESACRLFVLIDGAKNATPELRPLFDMQLRRHAGEIIAGTDNDAADLEYLMGPDSPSSQDTSGAFEDGEEY